MNHRINPPEIKPLSLSTPHRDNRAYVLGILNGLFFRSAQALIGSATVLPLFVATLTDKNWLIGLGSIMDIAGWFLPQIFGAYFILKRTYRLGWYVSMGVIRISAVGLIAVMTFVLGGSNKELLLPLFLCLEATYAITSGLAAVAFLDMVGKSVPAVATTDGGGRGSFFGWRIFLGGAAGITIGFLVVKPILEGVAYPNNFSLLFALATLTVALGIAAFSLVKEKPSLPTPHAERKLINHLRRSFRLVAEDRTYRRYFILRHLNTLWSMGIPFYILFANDRFDITPFWIGAYLAARFAGEMTFNVVWARLSDRGFNRSVLRGVSILSLVPPLLSLTLLFWDMPAAVYTLTFFLIGGRTSGMMLGGNNYILQHAPADQRPLYIGFTNSTLGLTLLSAGFGGLVVDLFSYHVLFGLVAIIALIALVAAVRLRPAGE